MKLLEKIKNAFFEEEYVEVEEKPKKKKNKRRSEVREAIPEEPIVKKVANPEKEKKEDEVVREHTADEIRAEFKFPLVSDNEFIEEVEAEKPLVIEEVTPYEEEEIEEFEIKRPVINKKKEKKPYGLDDLDFPKKEYGLYEKKEERTYFKPSPIISPIYGILDKNYKKDEIVSKKEVRLTSAYAREKVDVDDVREKAFGTRVESKEKEIVEDEIEEPVVDLSSENETPEVKEVTLADAEEYFEDLGLEYNVDYKDASKEKATGRRVKEDEPKEEEEEVREAEEDQEQDDDNLFDLIDSMYDKE